MKRNLRAWPDGAKTATREPSGTPNGAQEVQVATKDGPNRSQMIPDALRGDQATEKLKFQNNQ